MKKYKPFLLLILLTSCYGKIAYKKLDLDFGAIQYLIASGQLFSKSGMKETYLTFPLGGAGNYEEFEQGYLIFNLRRAYDPKTENKAYRILDSMNRARKVMEIDSANFNWQNVGSEELKYFAYLKQNYFQIKDRFDKHIKLHVEPESLKSGISYKSFLTYE